MIDPKADHGEQARGCDFTLRRLRPSHVPDKVHDPNAECIGDDLKGLKGYVALAAFYLANVCPVLACNISEHVLRPAFFLAQRTDPSPDLFLDGLHQQQFGASLFLTILVITSRTERAT